MWLELQIAGPTRPPWSLRCSRGFEAVAGSAGVEMVSAASARAGSAFFLPKPALRESADYATATGSSLTCVV